MPIKPRVREDKGRYTRGYKFFCSPNSRAQLHNWPRDRSERSTNKFIEMAINLAEEGTLPPCGLVRPHLDQVPFNGDGFGIAIGEKSSMFYIQFPARRVNTRLARFSQMDLNCAATDRGATSYRRSMS